MLKNPTNYLSLWGQIINLMRKGLVPDKGVTEAKTTELIRLESYHFLFIIVTTKFSVQCLNINVEVHQGYQSHILLQHHLQE